MLGLDGDEAILSFHKILTFGEDGACEIQDGRHHLQGLQPQGGTQLLQSTTIIYININIV